MSKTVTSFTAQLVTFTTPLPVSEVLRRLDKEVHREQSAGLIPFLKSDVSKDAFEEGLKRMANGNDFLFFLQFNHSVWMKIYHENVPTAIVYTIGNPIIAETLMKHDLRASLNIPPRLLILEKADGSGTDIVYHLPSSVMVLEYNTALKAAAQILDDKVDQLLTKVTEM
ncbi:uncharacterized protein BT62DRAFT_1073788 [Guyanagaster necrorhizus]|uniref:DUF302 domain-containing protein n=1 Tax=Guyanagaster necrorhizus TaxID=856835 RepID=A0A9P7VYJ1_9AGAR|nr:uncharacterized protein BT62DRAFT_1073788 [Guyanagaster necrorhizus MCA 3950]KAG7449304.1 hypothetical protein BT62DRAFT_1073788 [Guyanagaster necrorhizus MCA 3950]